MLGFMEEICFDNGNFPQFNDAAYGIVASKAQLVSYAAFSWLKIDYGCLCHQVDTGKFN